MSATTHGVYLVTNEDEFFLGRVMDILSKGPIKKEESPGEGISIYALFMDVVQEIVNNPTKKSQVVTIEIRE